jgi:hypothetical protein
MKGPTPRRVREYVSSRRSSRGGAGRLIRFSRVVSGPQLLRFFGGNG